MPWTYDRWRSDEPDPRELLRPFSSELMTIWPVATQVKYAEERRR